MDLLFVLQQELQELKDTLKAWHGGRVGKEAVLKRQKEVLEKEVLDGRQKFGENKWEIKIIQLERDGKVSAHQLEIANLRLSMSIEQSSLRDVWVQIPKLQSQNYANCRLSWWGECRRRSFLRRI
jgi:hypothetical protein